jgi:hypothetical protein
MYGAAMHVLLDFALRKLCIEKKKIVDYKKCINETPDMST